MGAAGPSQGARPLRQEGGCDAANAASLGEVVHLGAAGPSQGARPLLQEGGCDAANAAGPGKVV